MDGRMSEGRDGWIDVKMDGQIVGESDRRYVGWNDGWMSGWMNT